MTSDSVHTIIRKAQVGSGRLVVPLYLTVLFFSLAWTVDSGLRFFHPTAPTAGITRTLSRRRSVYPIVITYECFFYSHDRFPSILYVRFRFGKFCQFGSLQNFPASCSMDEKL